MNMQYSGAAARAFDCFSSHFEAVFEAGAHSAAANPTLSFKAFIKENSKILACVSRRRQCCCTYGCALYPSTVYVVYVPV